MYTKCQLFLTSSDLNTLNVNSVLRGLYIPFSAIGWLEKKKDI
jgi:hypothetical protein